MNNPDQKFQANPRDHFANERTFLAWIRTSIGVIAFGFIIERFSMFMKEIAYSLHEYHAIKIHIEHAKEILDSSTTFGIVLIAFGCLLCLLAYVKYVRAEKQIDANQFHPSPTLSLLLMLSVLFIGVVLFIFLIVQYIPYQL